MVLSENYILTEKDFNMLLVYTGLQESDNNVPSIAIYWPDGSPKTIEEIEQKAMELALKAYDNNITAAAKSLGMAKSTFYRKSGKN